MGGLMVRRYGGNCQMLQRLGSAHVQRGVRSRQQSQNAGPEVILPIMKAKGLTPILNVSDMPASFVWFEK